MDSKQLKNIIVLKNLPSNLIEEAIIILKNNKKIKILEGIESKNCKKELEENKEDYIIKEAEMVISNYLSRVEKEKQIKSYSIKKIEEKCRKFKVICIILSIIILIDFIFMM